MLLTAVITEAEEGGFIALNPETGTTTQGETYQDAIQNLNELNLSTTLVVTLQKGLNDDEIGEIIDETPPIKLEFKEVEEGLELVLKNKKI